MTPVAGASTRQGDTEEVARNVHPQSTPEEGIVSVIGRMEEVPLRTLWAHEERGFSVWLSENLDLLGEAVDLELGNAVREKQVGRFSLDLLVETGDGTQVIIENQLECTNHDHLGKVITYLSNLEAKVAIWIASEARDEHITAIRWLNEFTPADTAFFLVKLTAYRIGNSPPAPLFTLLARPSEMVQQIGDQKKEVARRHVERRAFWTQLLDRAKARNVLTHAQRSPSADSWLPAGAGIQAGVSYTYNIWTDSASVDLWFQNPSAETNKRLFDAYFARREEIERHFGAPLLWERMDERRASRIRFDISSGGLRSPEDEWPALQDEMIDAMDRLSRAIKAAGTMQ